MEPLDFMERDAKLDATLGQLEMRPMAKRVGKITSSNQGHISSDRVSLAVRVRPFTSKEIAIKSVSIVRMEGPNTFIRSLKDNMEKKFNFDYSY